MTAPAWLDRTPFAVFDLEMIGPDPETARPVQIAVLQIDQGLETGAWSTLVNPGCPIPEEASAVHKIYDADVADAPTWAQVAPAFLRLIARRGLVGYNAHRFDWPIVLRLLGELGPVSAQNQRRRVLDALVWARDIDRGGMGKGYHKLENLAPRWGVDPGDSHDALSDCRATWGVLRALAPQMPDLPLDAFLERQRRLYEADRRRFEAWLARQEARGAA